jgi:zinc transport system ATP-binding protein
MPASDLLLEIEDLCVAYDGVEVLQDISLEVRRGQFVCLIGPNGAGKSTLLKAIMNLVPRTRGRVVSHAQRIGYVPQQLPLDPALPLTVAEFLSLKAARSRFWFGAPRGSGREELRARLGEIGAAHLMDRRLGRLSGGEFQRILIAYALLGEPELLLLDEPLTGVDIRGGLSFDGLLHHLHDHRHIAIVMVSHDLHLVEHVGEVVYCINRDICCHGAPEEVLTPEALAKAYGHLPGMALDSGGGAFIPMRRIR